jgi:ABC-type glycerol-3-phosphate transport system substrate-binding protein
MGKMSVFQISIIVFFIVMAGLALLIFSGAINLDSQQSSTGPKGSIVMWGTYPHDKVSNVFDTYNQSHQGYTVTYIEKAPNALDNELAEAIASGGGPDLVILRQDDILNNVNKLYLIPYTSIPERTFRDTYIQEGELYMMDKGIIGLPISVDPMIMYYNRDIFEGAGITVPPKTWTQFLGMVPNLTKRDDKGVITQSAIPFGIYSNLNHAKDILSLLLFQAGDPIVAAQGSKFLSVLNQNPGGASVSPAQAVVDFFTQFADPSKTTYSWNKSFNSGLNQFINGELAVYFGYASELPVIAAKNPNLNFDVAKIPQPDGAKTEITFGQMQAVAVVKASKNLATALSVANDISGASFSASLVGAVLDSGPVAPARRDLLSSVPPSLYGPTLYSSAIISRGWLDPGSDGTNPIFQAMVDDVTRGATDSATSVNNAQSKLSLLLH